MKKNKNILLERMTDRLTLKLSYSDVGVPPDIFLKMNEVSLSLQGKSLPMLPKIKCKLLSECEKTCICYHELVSFRILRYFSNKIDGNINECDFFWIVE